MQPVGIQYIIDTKRKNCTIEAVEPDVTRRNDFDGPWDPSHVLLNHTSELFDLSGFKLSYQGQVRSPQPSEPQHAIYPCV